MELPTGTVTFLFTDIEGSARLWDEHPEEMRPALARHEALLHEAIGAHEGYVFHTAGDAFCVVFARATDALAAALDAQRALQAEPWAVGPLGVRMALHTGEAEERGGDYFGPPLNRCSRILSAGHGGQVLLSRTSAHLVREALPSGAELKPLGEHRLRDLAQPEGIFQLLHLGLPSEFPPLRSLAAFTHNLPIQLTSFIGREQELAEVKRLLGTTHLLTLTGTGGAGKTRLALQAGADLLDEYPDGVWLVELAALVEASLVPQAVASALGVREEPGRALVETLKDALRPKRSLLIIDNCEHLVGACAELAETLLRACPGVGVLATSREALGAEGEVLWRIPSLALPAREPGPTPPIEQLTQYAAVQLFIERAATARPGFRVTNENAPAVAEICWRLDGIPLAIELAATRVKVLPPEQIERRLDDRFRLLRGGRRTALPRQQTLRAAVEWSYDSLSPDQQALFDRLSVFAAGFSLEAAELVGAGGAIEQRAVLDLLTELADKSLVVPDEVDGEARYRLLESLRAYGWERLQETGEAEATRQRHASYFRDLAEEMRLAMVAGARADCLRRLDREHDNFRAALTWGLAHDVSTSLRLAVALQRFWELRGHWAEGREWVAQSLARAERVPLEYRAQGLYLAGLLALAQWDHGQAEPLLRDALTAARLCGDRRTEANAFNTLGNVAADRAHYDEAKDLYEQSLAIRQDLGDRRAIAGSLHNLAQVAHDRRDFAAARVAYEEVCPIWREVGDEIGLSATLNNLGNIATDQGDYDVGRTAHEEALALRRRVGDRPGVAGSLNNLAQVLHEQGHYDAARGYYEESLALAREVGHRRLMGATLGNLGNLAADEGHYAESRELHREELAIWQEIGHKPGVALSLGNLASVLLSAGEYGESRRLAEQALAIAREIEDGKCVANALHQLGRIALGEERHGEAQKLHCEELRIARAIDLIPGLPAALEGLARTAAPRDDPARAAMLLGAADTLRESMGTPMTQHQREGHAARLRAVRVALGDDAFEAAWAAGQAMTLEEAVTYALGEASDG